MLTLCDDCEGSALHVCQVKGPSNGVSVKDVTTHLAVAIDIEPLRAPLMGLVDEAGNARMGFKVQYCVCVCVCVCQQHNVL